MDSSLRELFARLGPIRVVDRVPFGSPAVIVLGLPRDWPFPQTVHATLALARRGMTLLAAKRAVEHVLVAGYTSVEPPTVEDSRALVDELIGAGFLATAAEPTEPLAVRPLRERLGLRLDAFADRFGFDRRELLAWEDGAEQPGAVASHYLRAIAADQRLGHRNGHEVRGT